MWDTARLDLDKLGTGEYRLRQSGPWVTFGLGEHRFSLACVNKLGSAWWIR